MSPVLISDALNAKLTAAGGAVELCTVDGTVVGYFTPTGVKKYNLDPGISDTPTGVKKYNLDPGISDEERDRRLAAGGGRPLKDILRDLEARG
jgi:hypothetical protein